MEQGHHEWVSLGHEAVSDHGGDVDGHLVVVDVPQEETDCQVVIAHSALIVFKLLREHL